MSARAKQLCLAVAAQAACLAVGLWMHHRYVLSSAVHAAEEQAWSEIMSAADAVSAWPDEPVPGDPAAANAALQRLVAAVADSSAQSSSHCSLTIVDPQWRVVFPPAGAQMGDTTPSSMGPPVKWIPDADAPDRTARWQRGRLVLPNGPHIALAVPLTNMPGHALIHQPIARIQAKSAALARTMPAVSALTFVWTCALLSIATYLVLTRLHEDADRERSQSATDALRRTQNLVRTRDAVIFGLAKLADSRDPDTGDHLERISAYSTTFAAALGRHPKVREQVTPAFVRLIGISSALHDIGKVGVKDRILCKPGPLSRDERASMQCHTMIGGECLREIEQHLGGSNFLQMAREIACAHHENWDGTGYPKGLAGTAIPLSARIVAVVDMYDAITSRRVYKEPNSHSEAVATIRSEAGKRLDPDLVEVWLTIEQRFRTIARQYADRPGRPAGRTRHLPEALSASAEFEQEYADLDLVSSGAASGTERKEV